jgi:hypothetical protein
MFVSESEEGWAEILMLSAWLLSPECNPVYCTQPQRHFSVMSNIRGGLRVGQAVNSALVTTVATISGHATQEVMFA